MVGNRCPSKCCDEYSIKEQEKTQRLCVDDRMAEKVCKNGKWMKETGD
jgi:hypothetical protein